MRGHFIVLKSLITEHCSAKSICICNSACVLIAQSAEAFFGEDIPPMGW